MDRINLFRNNIVIMYEPELEHEFCDAMTINTPTQPDIGALAKKSNDNALSLVSKVANE